MKFGVRSSIILVGLLLLAFSWYLGDWAIWIGGPMVFMGVILKYIDAVG